MYTIRNVLDVLGTFFYKKYRLYFLTNISKLIIFNPVNNNINCTCTRFPQALRRLSKLNTIQVIA